MSMKINQVRLIVVGDSGVGKTSLLVSLFRHGKWIANSRESHAIQNSLSMSVSSPNMDTQIVLHSREIDVLRSVKMLYCPQAVYLVVWKGRIDSVSDWIEKIRQFAPESKIIVLEINSVTIQGSQELKSHKALDAIHEHFKNNIYQKYGRDVIRGFLYFDNLKYLKNRQSAEVDSLIEAIFQSAIDLPEMGRLIPTNWKDAFEALQATGKQYLPYTEVVDLCIKANLDIEQAKLFIETFHKVGYFIHEKDEPSLRNIVIIKPDWLENISEKYLLEALIQGRKSFLQFLLANSDLQVPL